MQSSHASASRCTGAAWSGRWRAKKNESIEPDCRASRHGRDLREGARRSPVSRSNHESRTRHSSPPRFGGMDAGTGARPSCRGGLPRSPASALRQTRSVATGERRHPPNRRNHRLPRYGAHPCLSSRSRPTISSAMLTCMSANPHCGKSPNTARARSANMRCVLARLRQAGRSSAFA